MSEVIIGDYRGRQGAGLPPRQLEAVLHSANDLTAKQIARKMGISPATVTKTLDRARFALGMQRSVRGLCLEAIKRGIIAPLVLALMVLGTGTATESSARRPPARIHVVRILRNDTTAAA